MYNYFKKNVGTSLVEVLIGVILLALIMIPSLNVVIGQTKTVNATRDHAQAAFIADKIIETAKAWDFKMLDKDTFKKFYKDDDTKKEEQTLEFQLTDSNANDYNKYELNGITYTVDKDFTCIEPIYTKDVNKDEAIPSLYSFKYRIIYKGQDKQEHSLDIYTVLAQR